ncbi:MAG TPA: hypothetical protein VJJ73_00415 [Candidatus Paceibacterota bacterium]
MVKGSLEVIESISSGPVLFLYKGVKEGPEEDLAAATALIFLREKATALGANVVALSHRTTLYHEDGRSGSPSRGEKVIYAIAYRFRPLPACGCGSEPSVHQPNCASEVERLDRVRALEE